MFLAYGFGSRRRDWLGGHFLFQIRTLWIAVGWTAGLAAVWVMVGVWISATMRGSLLVLPVVLAALVLSIWWLTRCIKGPHTLGQSRPLSDPRTRGAG